MGKYLWVINHGVYTQVELLQKLSEDLLGPQINMTFVICENGGKQIGVRFYYQRRFVLSCWFTKNAAFNL